MQVMLCQSDLILLHKWGLDDSQSHTTVLLFRTLRLLFFQNLPTPTFIPDPTFISDPRVEYNYV